MESMNYEDFHKEISHTKRHSCPPSTALTSDFLTQLAKQKNLIKNPKSEANLLVKQIKPTFVDEIVANRFENLIGCSSKLNDVAFVVGLCGNTKDLLKKLAKEKILDTKNLEKEGIALIPKYANTIIQWFEKLKKKLPTDPKYHKDFALGFYNEIRALTKDENKALVQLAAVKMFLKSVKLHLKQGEMGLQIINKNAPLTPHQSQPNPNAFLFVQRSLGPRPKLHRRSSELNLLPKKL